MSSRRHLLPIVFLAAPHVAVANPIAAPRKPDTPAAPGLQRMDSTVRFVKDPEVGVGNYFAVVRIPRDHLRKLLHGRNSNSFQMEGVSTLMTVIAGISLSAAAVAAGLTLRSRLRATPLVLLGLAAVFFNGIALSASAWQERIEPKALFPPDSLVQVPCIDQPFLAVLETYDSEPGADCIQIHLPANLTPPSVERLE